MKAKHYHIIAVENNRHVQHFFVKTKNLEETKEQIFDSDPNIYFLLIHEKEYQGYQSIYRWDFIYHFRKD